MTAQEDIIRIKDKRKGVFTVDNVVMNGYGKALGATGIAFYVTLCRYANNQTQQAFPSITTIQNETGMDRKTIIAAAKRAEELKLIRKQVKEGAYTVYTLLEPKKYPYGNSTSMETPPTGGDSTTTRVDFPYTSGDSEENELRRTNLDNGKLKLIRKNLEAKGILPSKPIIKSYPQS